MLQKKSLILIRVLTLICCIVLGSKGIVLSQSDTNNWDSGIFRGNYHRSGSFQGELPQRPPMLKWQYPTTGRKSAIEPFFSPVVADNKVFCVVSRKIIAVDIQTGNKKWHYKLSKQIPSVPGIYPSLYSAPLAQNGNVYFCVDVYQKYSDNYGKVISLDVKTGKEKWNYFIKKLGAWSSPTLHEDLLIVPTLGGEIIFLDAKTGKKKSRFETFAPISCVSAIDEGMLYFINWDLKLFCFDIKKQEKKWELDLFIPYKKPSPMVIPGYLNNGIVYSKDIIVPSSPAIDGNTIFIKVYDQIPDSQADGLYYYSWKGGLFRGRLIAVNKLNGEINWEFREPIPENLKKMKKIEDERHDFSTSFKGLRYTIKVKDIPKKKVLVRERIDSKPVERMVNKVFHQYSIVNYDPLSSSPAIALDSICVGSEDGNLYIVNKIDGKLRWKFETNAIILSSPIIVDGTIIFCDTNKFLYALDLATGNKIWVRDIGKGSVSSACIENNILYFTTSMKGLQALK